MHDHIREYYGKTITNNHELKTKACCCDEEAFPAEIKKIIKQLEPAVTERFYGCGCAIPPLLAGCTVLDLGCGAGRDAYVLAKLVGEQGRVIGVDITEEQLTVAQNHIASHMEKFGYAKPNIDFKMGRFEDLKVLKIKDESIDVVISNCAVNLSADKSAVFREIFRVLQPGGELYFSDVFAGRRVPEQLKDDPVLHGECLAGALYIEDFRRLLRDCGCPDYRVVSSAKINLDNSEVEAKIGMVDFYSMTIRAFKVGDLEDICEDYGQTATYRGSIPGQPHFFDLDDHHRFISGKPMLVCGNTASMLGQSRFGEHFVVTGDRSVHYGPFACGPARVGRNAKGSGGACC